MFADYIKMAAKLALVVVITAAIITLLNIITIPNFDISAISSYLTIAYTFATHWCPFFPVLYPIAMALLTLELGIMAFDVTSMAWRWIFKVNE